MQTGPPETLAGRYRLDALLGRGGMGEVYRATDLHSGAVVAVKLMRAADEDLERAATRFVREARRTVAVRHPNIVRALDFGSVPPGILYLVMEHLEGESVARLAHREGRLTAERVVHIGTQMCAALEAVHAQGIVHRDVKAGNVMRVPTAADPDFIKLIDFGIARGDGEETRLTGTGMVVGSMEYAPPEQIMGKPLDGRADQYALGVMLYRLLGGVAPFDAKDTVALVRQHLEATPLPLTFRVPDAAIPPALDAVVLRCLSKQPDARHASMAELAAALRKGLQGEPDDTTLRAPVPLARLDQIDELELDVGNNPGREPVLFRRCAKCASDNSRFATSCIRCGADLGTPDQLAFMAGLVAQAKATATSAEPPETEPQAVAQTAPPEAPTLRDKLVAPALRISEEVYTRLLGYSVAALAIGYVFSLFNGLVNGGLLGLALIGLLGMAAHWVSGF